MNNENALKELVRTKYSDIALQSKETNQSACCGSGCCSTDVTQIMHDEYHHLKGYASEADLGLGCGLPTEFARINPGDVVVDLGSGAGNDCFVARAETGETGRVIGIDFTPAMVAKARENAARLGYENVEFREGDIEFLPLADNIANVVISNCVLNLVPNKQAVINEIYRVLQPGGHFSISDIVLNGNLPAPILQAAEMYAGCVAGAIQKDVYLDLIAQAGFVNIQLQKEKDIFIPDDILSQYLTEEEIAFQRNNHDGIVSITVYAEKPASAKSCCGDSCCK